MGLKKLLVVLGGLLLAVGCHSPQVREPNPPSSVEDCLKEIRVRYGALKDRSDRNVEKRMHAELALCVAPELTAAQAACVGAVYADFAELSRQLSKGKVTPAEWLQRTRDRNRKLERFLKDAALSESQIAGDADQDLVPDAMDRCPETPAGAATDEAGCPIAKPALADGPTPEEMREFFGLHVLLPNRRCENAPPPTTPARLEANSLEWPAGSRPRLSLRLEEVSNQPAECPVVYEVILEEIVPLRLDNPAQPPRTPERLRMVLNPEKGRRVAGNPSTVIFEKEHPRMTFFFHQTCRLKVRAINGNGSTSPWTQKVRVGQR